MTIPSGLIANDPSVMLGGLVGGPQQAPTQFPQATNTGSPSQPLPSLRDKVYDYLSRHFMATPPGVDGLLSADDLRHAREGGLLRMGLSLLSDSRGAPGQNAPSFNQGIANAIQNGVGGFQQNVGNMLQSKAQGQVLSNNQQAMTDAASMRALRDRIGAQFPAQPGETPTQRIDRVMQMAEAYANGGDFETAARLGQLGDAMRKSLSDANNKYQAVQAGDAVYRFDPSTGEFTKGPDRGLDADTIRFKKAALEEQQAKADEAKMEFQQRRADAYAKGFISRVKPITDTGVLLDHATAAIKEAQTDPRAWPSALSNFVQATDAKPRMQLGILEYYGKDLGGGSVQQKFQLWVHRMATGTLPGYTARDLLHIVDIMRQQNIHAYEAQRAAEVKRHPAIDDLVPHADEFFNAQQQQQPGATGAAPSATNSRASLDSAGRVLYPNNLLFQPIQHP